MQIMIKIEIQILIRTRIQVKIFRVFAIYAIHQDIHPGIVTNK